MWMIRSKNKIDFLWENGLKPEYEISGVAYYYNNRRLHSLLDRYYIQYTLIPNSGWRY